MIIHFLYFNTVILLIDTVVYLFTGSDAWLNKEKKKNQFVTLQNIHRDNVFFNTYEIDIYSFEFLFYIDIL